MSVSAYAWPKEHAAEYIAKASPDFVEACGRIGTARLFGGFVTMRLTEMGSLVRHMYSSALKTEKH